MKFCIKIIILCLFSAITACSALNPVKSNQIDPGIFQLSAYGNIFSNQQKLQTRLNKKAEKICGENNYTFQPKINFKVITNKQLVNNQLMDISSIYLERIAECINN